MVQTRGPHRTRCGHTERHRSEVCSDRIPWPSFTNLCVRGHAARMRGALSERDAANCREEGSESCANQALIRRLIRTPRSSYRDPGRKGPPPAPDALHTSSPRSPHPNREHCGGRPHTRDRRCTFRRTCGARGDDERARRAAHGAAAAAHERRRLDFCRRSWLRLVAPRLLLPLIAAPFSSRCASRAVVEVLRSIDATFSAGDNGGRPRLRLPATLRRGRREGDVDVDDAAVCDAGDASMGASPVASSRAAALLASRSRAARLARPTVMLVTWRAAIGTA